MEMSSDNGFIAMLSFCGYKKMLSYNGYIEI
jgi:hypothetical protein